MAKRNYRTAPLGKPNRARPSEHLDERLSELAEQWNPLLSADARRNLVADVNSFIFGHLRVVQRRVALTASDTERIANLAERISEETMFAQITRKAIFREYIQLVLTAMLRPRTAR